jgi:hypothetical protein
MSHPFLSLLFFLSFLPVLAFAGGQDDNHDFHRGQGGDRGNERSERPGRVDRGQLNYGGNGCPNGTMQVAFAPDNLSFTILFDNFVADTQARDQGAMSCEANLPITIPAGQQMEITRVDYRGFVNVPQGARAFLQSTFNFAGGEHDRVNLRYAFNGPLQEEYEVSSGAMNEGHDVPKTEVSPCGGQAQLHFLNAVRVQAPKGQEAQLTVDSIDGHGNAVYYVNWKSCRPGDGNGGDHGDHGDQGDQGNHGNQGGQGHQGDHGNHNGRG